jgi:hypothetical protein
LTSKTRNSTKSIGTGLENSLGYLPWHKLKDWELHRILEYLLQYLLISYL